MCLLFFNATGSDKLDLCVLGFCKFFCHKMFLTTSASNYLQSNTAYSFYLRNFTTYLLRSSLAMHEKWAVTRCKTWKSFFHSKTRQYAVSWCTAFLMLPISERTFYMYVSLFCINKCTYELTEKLYFTLHWRAPFIKLPNYKRPRLLQPTVSGNMCGWETHYSPLVLCLANAIVQLNKLFIVTYICLSNRPIIVKQISLLRQC